MQLLEEEFFLLQETHFLHGDIFWSKNVEFTNYPGQQNKKKNPIARTRQCDF